MDDRLDIDPDIRRARSLPPALYHEASWYRRVQRRLLPRTWHMHPAPLPAPKPDSLRPWNFLAGSLDEPLLITHDGDADLRLLSNVCTHRGAILVERPGAASELRCPHHGRSFALDGRLLCAPGFEGAEGSPRPCDDLTSIPWARWQRYLFASLAPEHPLDALVGPLERRLSFLPWDRLGPSPALVRDYHVAASWVLYCDHALDHHPDRPVPVGESDADTTPPPDAPAELLPLGVLRPRLASGDAPVVRPPPGHPDHDLPLAGYRAWLFPSTVIDVAAWGVSLRIVLPLGAERTRIVHLVDVWDPEGYGPEVAAALDEREHHAGLAVESVARGVRARAYDRSRYRPDHDTGLHHFHRLLARFLDP